MMIYTSPVRNTRVLTAEEYRKVAYAELLNNEHMRKLMRRIKKARDSEAIRKILNEPFII